MIAGGKSDSEAHYVDPTLLYPITWDDKIMEDEIFGPILPILTYKSFDEAMARMAATPRALAGFIFSRDQKAIDRFIGFFEMDTRTGAEGGSRNGGDGEGVSDADHDVRSDSFCCSGRDGDNAHFEMNTSLGLQHADYAE